ncbi:MAG: hypothetical protein UW07_C0044G0007 [Candidatus Nomurabacteria bacterium GW2011_GWF2_43_8]|uniref:Uncharacterized protein n=2 Tax=Candidatus Nomuraibacteriota TaxID=1752729 RepID=A0A0G1HRC4_9BACT|nr:MAG: hypothetical protein UW02_C0002G0015 [Candidatus Nomurabacteria bacterium GW2011_GWB1_43_7]KKT22122.1 MAG: hypothetical protein UW07_C0044G0007 [Candidatus Nomurabacteria bacterium GW2011_GWF2_43_8]
MSLRELSDALNNRKTVWNPYREELTIICPFCNASYTSEMEEELKNCEDEDSNGTNFSSIVGEITIKCSNCKKVVYKKEIT